MTREVPTSLAKLAHAFVYARGNEVAAKREKESARNDLKDLLLSTDESIREDENGHRYLDINIPDGDAQVVAIRAQRNVSSSIDLDKAEVILRLKGNGVYDRVFKRVVTRRFDESALYALNQQGIVTDDELDEMIVESVTYSLGTVKE